MSIVFPRSESYRMRVTALGSSFEAITSGSPRLSVPCFHPAGDPKAQRRAISRASHITLLCHVVTQHLNDLLQHIRPTCHLNLYHTDGYTTSDVPLCIPPTASIEIDSSKLCAGSGTAAMGVLKHCSKRVMVRVEDDCEEDLTNFIPLCRIGQQIVTPLVEHLTVTGNVCALPSHYRDVDIESAPQLEITVLHSDDDCRQMDQVEIDNLRRETANLFKIPVQQVQYLEED